MKSLQSPVPPETVSLALARILDRLAEARVIPAAAAALDAAAPDLLVALRAAVLAEAPAFTASGNPEILPGLDRHARDQVAEIKRLLGGGRVGGFDFVRAQAQLRAEQRFPLEATLHAYRCGQRILSQWLRGAVTAMRPRNLEQAVSAAADFALEYTNTISTIATFEYVAHTRRLVEAEGDLRTELLNILLSGYDESDGRVARLLKRAGYLEQRQSYCVVVAQAAHPGEMENLARAQRIASAVADALAATSIRVLSGIRNNLVIAVLSDKRRQSGWTPRDTDLAERARPMLLALGTAVLVGVSADHPSTSFVPKALQEAILALEHASLAKRVVAFADLPIRDLLLHRGAEALHGGLPNWAHDLAAADVKATGALVGTLRAIADADMNIQQAARQLGKHPNTVYARLQRIRSLTGLDGQRYHDLTELLLAADSRRP